MKSLLRKLSDDEILMLEKQGCSCGDWNDVFVSDAFSVGYISNVSFSGHVELGVFGCEILLPGGVRKHSGIRNAVLHNVTVGNDCVIENVNNYIANYSIGDNTVIINIDCMFTDGVAAFGNGVKVSVMDETGGREVMISDKLSAHQAYIMALYRHRPKVAEKMRELVRFYSDKHASATGSVGRNVCIVNAGYIRNVRIGDFATVRGASRLCNGSINSNAAAPVHVGDGVIMDDFIVSSGTCIDEGTVLNRCFVGQSCHLGHGYSASDSLFFSNCHGENGEACSIFAGPFTVTHHKSTLLIAGMFSFMNAGSGSNQSNHMYKLGPMHQGILERGAKTTSDSYILWPARIGAFSLVMGRHVSHPDTSDLPFSYLIEQEGKTNLVPGVNLRSVGTIRDAGKWPKRDGRKDPNRLDFVNYNLLSPFTVQKMFRAIKILESLRSVSGETSESYSFQSARIKNSSLVNGLRLYDMAVNKFMGNSIIKRLEGMVFSSDDDVRARLVPDTATGQGEWVDIAGLIAPKTEIEKLLTGIEDGSVDKLKKINACFEEMNDNYYTYEWTWAYGKIEEFYGVSPQAVTAEDVVRMVDKWEDAVIGLDRMVYEDARKEFSLSFKTGFGADGSSSERELDFEQVRGDFENNVFVRTITEHIKAKKALGEELKARLAPVVAAKVKK